MDCRHKHVYVLTSAQKCWIRMVSLNLPLPLASNSDADNTLYTFHVRLLPAFQWSLKASCYQSAQDGFSDDAG